MTAPNAPCAAWSGHSCGLPVSSEVIEIPFSGSSNHGRAEFAFKRKKGVAMITTLTRPHRLKEASATIFGTIGANVMVVIEPLCRRFDAQHKAAPQGLKGFVVALKFRAAVEVYHFGFKLMKRAQEIKLRCAGLDELVFENRDELRRLLPIVTFTALEEFSNSLSSVGAVLDHLNTRFKEFKRTIQIHPSAYFRSSEPDVSESERNDRTDRFLGHDK